ncbi:hypothetical protein ACMD2_13908 [Ananas comosus]|uniref:Serine aminopeptidase S33 domain-containing protein n=1 Tax=Ananas comosus TaxID=4615 RepID=A0A199UP04_ANACO|nr:hypothetical protein ACMD2_13908 [Ananas comosus]
MFGLPTHRIIHLCVHSDSAIAMFAPALMCIRSERCRYMFRLMCTESDPIRKTNGHNLRPRYPRHGHVLLAALLGAAHLLPSPHHRLHLRHSQTLPPPPPLVSLLQTLHLHSQPQRIARSGNPRSSCRSHGDRGNFELIDRCRVDSPVEVEEGFGALMALPGDEADKLPIGSRNGLSNMSQQKIVIKNKHGENLVGLLHEAGSKELVILCHGFRSSKESKTISSLSDSLTSENVSTFRFDFSEMGRVRAHFSMETTERESATKCYYGHSKGGNVVILYASIYNDISIVINISGRFHMKRGIEERLGKDYMERIEEDGFIDVRDKMGRYAYRVTKESLMDRLKTDMGSACSLVDKNCRVLTIHGSEDDIVPSEDALEFANTIGDPCVRMKSMGTQDIILGLRRGKYYTAAVFAFVGSVQAEEIESRDAGDCDHAYAHQECAHNPFPDPGAELAVEVAYLHPLQLCLPELPQHRRLRCCRHRRQRHEQLQLESSHNTY